MPKLTIVIGANGAGKTTWCDRRANRARLPADFYNADSVAKGLGDWNSPKKQSEARRLVNETIDAHLKKRTSFGFESTYSGRSRPDIVRRAKAAGFETEAIFIGTARPEINIERVVGRVLGNTGHDVPVSEIRRRWVAVQDNMKRTASLLDRIELIDNSGKRTRSVVRIEAGRETGRAAQVPTWAKRLAHAVTRNGGRRTDQGRQGTTRPTTQGR